MKKLSILFSGVLALAAFTACDDAPEAATPQKNPQPALFSNADVTATLAATLADASQPGAEPLNLQDYREANIITVMENISYTNVPAGSEVVFELQISNEASFPAEGTRSMVASANAEGKATVLTSDWNAYHYELVGKSMTPKTFYFRVYGYISLDNSKYMIGEADPADPSKLAPKVFAQGEYKEVPFELVIDSAYYFLSNGTTWDLSEGADYKFDHDGDDVYENPVFTFQFEVSDELAAGGDYWKIASQKAIDNADWAAAYGPSINGDKSLSGKLIVNGQAGQINEPGKYTITINMEEMTYEIVKQTRPEFVAVPSNVNGWNESGSRLYWSNKEDKPYFCGAARVNNTDGGFKFIWDETWYGPGEEEGTLADIPGGDNIKAPVDATRLYWFTVSTEKLTYTIDEVTSLGIIGVKGWDADNDVIEMTPSDDYSTWTVDTHLSGGWKILINHNWASNYGYDDDNVLTFDTSDIKGYDGDYTVTLSFTENRPTLTVTEK